MLAARNGDRAAVQQLCRISYHRVLRVAEACVRNPSDAEDVAQQVMVKLIEALPTDRIDVESFDGWLFTVARNQAFDHLRRAQHAQPEAPDQIDQRRDAPGLAPPPADRWRFDPRVSQVIDLLPRRHREVLLLRYGFDLSSEETALVLGCSSASVRQSVRRALTFLSTRIAVPGLIIADLLSDL